MTIHCSGLCGRVVTEAGQFCSGCDVPVFPPVYMPYLLQSAAAFVASAVSTPDVAGFEPTIPTDSAISVLKQQASERESSYLRQRVLHHSYRLAMGNKAERKDALEELTKLVAILNQ